MPDSDSDDSSLTHGYMGKPPVLSSAMLSHQACSRVVIGSAAVVCRKGLVEWHADWLCKERISYNGRNFKEPMWIFDLRAGRSKRFGFIVAGFLG